MGSTRGERHGGRLAATGHAIRRCVAVNCVAVFVAGCSNNAAKMPGKDSTRGTSTDAGALNLTKMVHDAGGGGPSDSDGGWAPLAPTFAYRGKKLGDWVSSWGQWAYAETSCDDPEADTTGASCALYQDDPDVFFFAGSISPVGVMRTQCVVPRGKAILVPLTSMMADNAGVPAAQVLTDDELTRLAASAKTATNLELVLDGTSIQALDAYAVGPLQFSYTLPDATNWYTCNGQEGVTGTVDPSFIGGIFVLLPPPTAGMHVIQYGGTYVSPMGAPQTTQIEATFTVE